MKFHHFVIILICYTVILLRNCFHSSKLHPSQMSLSLVVPGAKSKTEFFTICGCQSMAGLIRHENWVLLFSTMSLHPVKQKFELVQFSPEATWEVRNPLSVSFEGCGCSVQNLNLLLCFVFNHRVPMLRSSSDSSS